MPVPFSAQSALQPPAPRERSAPDSRVIEISGGGRITVGDRRPAAKSAVLVASPPPEPAVKPAAMGCSGYRVKYGTSDEEIVRAIREHAATSVAETDGSLWAAASSLTDEQLLAVIAWSVTAKTACARVAKHLSDMSA
jgi:hypothetical protein